MLRVCACAGCAFADDLALGSVLKLSVLWRGVLCHTPAVELVVNEVPGPVRETARRDLFTIVASQNRVLRACASAESGRDLLLVFPAFVLFLELVEC